MTFGLHLKYPRAKAEMSSNQVSSSLASLWTTHDEIVPQRKNIPQSLNLSAGLNWHPRGALCQPLGLGRVRECLESFMMLINCSHLHEQQPVCSEGQWFLFTNGPSLTLVCQIQGRD